VSSQDQIQPPPSSRHRSASHSFSARRPAHFDFTLPQGSQGGTAVPCRGRLGRLTRIHAGGDGALGSRSRLTYETLAPHQSVAGSFIAFVFNAGFLSANLSAKAYCDAGSTWRKADSYRESAISRLIGYAKRYRSAKKT